MKEHSPNDFLLMSMVVVGIFAGALTSMKKNGIIPQIPIYIFTVHCRLSVVFVGILICMTLEIPSLCDKGSVAQGPPVMRAGLQSVMQFSCPE